MRRLWPLLLCAAAAGCARRGSVVAEGWAPIDRADPAATRQRALALAQRAAVERALGVSVRARAKVEKNMALEQTVESSSGGFIERFDVLSEREQGGFLIEKIRAFVKRGQHNAQVRRVALSVDGEASAQAAVRRALALSGLEVSNEADIVFRGEVGAARIESQAPWPAWRARLDWEARERSSGRLIAAGAHQASAVDPIESVAAAKACERAGALAAEQLARSLSAAERD